MNTIEHNPENYGKFLKTYLEELAVGPRGDDYTFVVKSGRKFDKVITTTKGYGSGGQESVFCFVDKSNGNLLKAADWSTPAKGERGSIYAEKRPLESGDFYLKG